MVAYTCRYELERAIIVHEGWEAPGWLELSGQQMHFMPMLLLEIFCDFGKHLLRQASINNNHLPEPSPRSSKL